MCFSAKASFTASTVLSLIGIIGMTRISSWRQVMFAIIPFHFATHQFIEGLIWQNLESNGSREAVLLLSYIYLFLSGFVWPIWMPACLIPMEQEKSRRKLLYLFVLAGVIFSTVSYSIVLHDGINPRILNAHIDYMPMTLYYFIIYCLISITPFFIIKSNASKYFKWFGFLLALSFLLGYLICVRCAASIWCFFAAISSIFVVLTMNNLKKAKV